MAYTFSYRSLYRKVQPMTTQQAADILGISVKRVQALIKSGRLIAEKKGRDWHINPDALQAVKDRPNGRPKKTTPAPAPVEPAPAQGADLNFDSPAWQAKRKLEFVKEQHRQGAATFEQVAAAADAYIAEIDKWAKSKGRKVKLPSRASLTR
jgi:excisionase family DNA binding protein